MNTTLEVIDDIEINKLIIERIKGICDERKISIYRLAKITGLSRSTLSWLLNGRYKNIKSTTIVRICKGLNISIAEFFNYKLFY